MPAKIVLEKLIKELYDKMGKVVVLVDEYDKPLLDHIEKERNRSLIGIFLKNFYGVLKSEDEYIRFIFLTGVTKFSKVSVFSGLNNLYDITMDPRYATMLGYTQEELESDFQDYIEEFSGEQKISRRI